jgi:hypothetical protein
MPGLKKKGRAVSALEGCGSFTLEGRFDESEEALLTCRIGDGEWRSRNRTSLTLSRLVTTFTYPRLVGNSDLVMFKH